jgi:hypothetical protein
MRVAGKCIDCGYTNGLMTSTVRRVYVLAFDRRLRPARYQKVIFITAASMSGSCVVCACACARVRAVREMRV